MAHKPDIGGPVPGSCLGSARETYNEGLHLPPVRYATADGVSADLERIIAANSRTPELVLGDLRGQLGACRLGERRLAELAAKYGLVSTLRQLAQLVQRGVVSIRVTDRSSCKPQSEHTLPRPPASAEREAVAT
jgi:N-methylhydantoinase B